jgi:hypothetical protein
MCGTPSEAASRAAWVLFPLPGAPRSNTRLAPRPPVGAVGPPLHIPRIMAESVAARTG